MTATADAYSPPFDWIGGDGAPYRAVTFAGPGYHHVQVFRRGPGTGGALVTVVRLDPDDNPYVAFDEWRAEHTGFDYGDNPYPAWAKRYPDGHPSAGAGLSEHARYHETRKLTWPHPACEHCTT